MSSRDHGPRPDYPPAERVQFAPHVLQEILDVLTGLPSALRQNFVDQLWSSIPSVVDEYAFSPSQVIGQALNVQPTVSTLTTVQAVVTSLPAGATGLLQLDSAQLPVTGGVNVLTGLNKLLGPTATRSLTLLSTPSASAQRINQRVPWSFAATPAAQVAVVGSGMLYSATITNRDTAGHAVIARDASQAANVGDGAPLIAPGVSAAANTTSTALAIPSSGSRFANGIGLTISNAIAADGNNVFIDLQYALDAQAAPIGLWIMGAQAPTYGVIG